MTDYELLKKLEEMQRTLEIPKEEVMDLNKVLLHVGDAQGILGYLITCIKRDIKVQELIEEGDF